MNPERRPVVAHTMRVGESEYGPEYSVTCDAYGLEMNIDDDSETSQTPALCLLHQSTAKRQ